MGKPLGRSQNVSDSAERTDCLPLSISLAVRLLGYPEWFGRVSMAALRFLTISFFSKWFSQFWILLLEWAFSPSNWCMKVSWVFLSESVSRSKILRTTFFARASIGVFVYSQVYHVLKNKADQEMNIENITQNTHGASFFCSSQQVRFITPFNRAYWLKECDFMCVWHVCVLWVWLWFRNFPTKKKHAWKGSNLYFKKIIT